MMQSRWLALHAKYIQLSPNLTFDYKSLVKTTAEQQGWRYAWSSRFYVLPLKKTELVLRPACEI